MLTREELEREYQKIAFWINNIDTKISFALGATGVLIGFILSNDDLSKTLKKHYKAILVSNDYSINNAIWFLLFGITVVLLVAAMWCLLNGLTAKIDSNKYSQPHMVSPSNIYWGDIAKFDFYTYKYRMENSHSNDWEEDIQTQIYINSCICTQKAKYYNRGISCLKISLLVFVVYHIWMWFFL